MTRIDPQAIASSPSFEKLHQIPAVYYSTWLQKCGGHFSGKIVLDFGCGEGLVTAGLALFCDVLKVTGVDIIDDFRALDGQLASVGNGLRRPPNIDFLQVAPCEDLGRGVYDIIVSWSVLEHVSEDILDKQLEILGDALRPDGFMICQIAPLYYSPFGSHLFELHDPWEHLVAQTSLLKNRVYSAHRDSILTADALWGCFQTLNRLTAPNLLHRLRRSDFDVLQTYETTVNLTPPESLLAIFNHDVLITEQVLVVCKPSPH